jgi:hypothetical protein
VHGALSIGGLGDPSAARWAVLACAALALVVGALALVRVAGGGPGVRTALERLWTALPLALLVALLVLSVRAL